MASVQQALDLLPSTLAASARKAAPRKRRSPRLAAPALTTRAEHTTGVDNRGRRTWTIQIPAPAGWINANGRTDTRALGPIVKAWREAARLYALQAKLPRGLARVHVLARCHFVVNRRRDVGNSYPTAKAAVDGLVDYGLIADDNDDILLGPDMRRGPNVDKKAYPGGGLLVLTITELTDEEDEVAP